MNLLQQLDVSTKAIIDENSRSSYGHKDDAGLIRSYQQLGELTLTKSMIASRGDQCDLFRSIIELAHTGDQLALNGALKDPIYLDTGRELRPKLASLFGHSPSSHELELVTLPKEFKIDIKRMFGKRGLDLSTLEDIYTRSLSKTGIPEFLNSIIDLYNPLEEFPYRKFFEIAKNAIGNQNLSFPTESAKDIYVLTFMPTWLRYVAQDIIVAETLVKKLSQEEIESDKTNQTLNLISRYLRYDALISDHWTRLAEASGDEIIQKEIAQQRIESFSLLKELSDKREDIEIKAAIGKYSEVRALLSREVFNSYKHSSCREWQNTDTGHGFKNFESWGLSYATDGFYQTLGIKDGSYAVILEDIPEQAARWSNLIDLYSSRMLLPQGKSHCEDLTTLGEHIDNPAVNLFLLDIQNPTNPRAGIEAAEMIIRKRFSWKENMDVDTIQKTDIIVWSYNSEALKDARKYLSELISKLDPKGDNIGGIGFSCSLNWIEIDIRNKANNINSYLFMPKKSHDFT